jgi:prepilin-type processing-associated H-X9-DG protein
MSTITPGSDDGSVWFMTEVKAERPSWFMTEVKAGRPPRKRVWRSFALALVTVGFLASIVVFGVVPSIREAQRTRCSDNLKRLGLAFHNYQDAHGSFPAPAILSRDGTALLSWRVEILPQLGHQALYDQFHRDEPWDSPHNRALLAKIPPEFVCPSASSSASRREGLTGYQVVVGPKTELGSVNTPFEPDRGADIREFTDGTSNTLLVAETNALVPWTKPDDLRWERGAPPPAFGSRHPGGFQVLLADGSARFIKHTIVATTLLALITINGGGVVSA